MYPSFVVWSQGKLWNWFDHTIVLILFQVHSHDEHQARQIVNIESAVHVQTEQNWSDQYKSCYEKCNDLALQIGSHHAFTSDVCLPQKSICFFFIFIWIQRDWNWICSIKKKANLILTWTVNFLQIRENTRDAMAWEINTQNCIQNNSGINDLEKCVQRIRNIIRW